MTAFDRIKELAEKRGWSIVETEEKLGFGKNSLYSWKKNNPSSDKLTKAANLFNVSTDFLLGRTDDPYQHDNKSIARQIMLRSEVSNLSEDDAEEIEQEIERFLNWRLEEIKRERSEKD